MPRGVANNGVAVADIFDKVHGIIDDSEKLRIMSHPYYSFEPWDVGVRPDWVKKIAEEDGIDLYHPDIIKHTGTDPHDFQTGFMLSTKFNSNTISASQVGKSYSALIKIFCMLTGDFPISLRYEKGVDTNVKRVISEQNIIRFGRISKDTGEVIDRNPNAQRDDSWDCGNILGAGVFPQELVAPNGSTIRIGTFQRAKIEFWWPRLAESRRLIVPMHFIDRNRGADGYNKQDGMVYTQRGCVLSVITFEMGFEKFEADMAWYTAVDEEPPSDKIIASIATHSKRWSLHESPYHGVTFSKDIFFPSKKSADSQTFHATLYDSPYKTKEDIRHVRSALDKWQLGARVWGMPTEIKGAPYFDRQKLSAWTQKFSNLIPVTLAKFEPVSDYFGMTTMYNVSRIPGLVDTTVKMNRQTFDNLKNVWRVYEERMPKVAYILSGDPAEGALIPDEAGDISAAIVARQPIAEKKETHPVIVATLRSTLETIPFARTVAYAARYYNNALLAPEIRGSASATLANELKDWPYWYMHTNVQDSTGKARSKKGFDTTTKTRDAIFDLIKDWMLSFEEADYPYIPDMPLLKELSEAIVSTSPSGKQRCDHPSTGTLDSTIAFGIILYVLKNCPDQMRCNVAEGPPTNTSRRTKKTVKQICNLSYMGYGGQQCQE